MGDLTLRFSSLKGALTLAIHGLNGAPQLKAIAGKSFTEKVQLLEDHAPADLGTVDGTPAFNRDFFTRLGTELKRLAGKKDQLIDDYLALEEENKMPFLVPELKNRKRSFPTAEAAASLAKRCSECRRLLIKVFRRAARENLDDIVLPEPFSILSALRKRRSNTH